MNMPAGRAWPRPVIGWLALIAGVCMACRLLLPTRLSVVLPLVAAALILVTGIFLVIERRNPALDRWGRAICSAGVAIYLIFPLATIAGGDIEGGIPVGAQVVWQTVAIGAVITATPVLIVGGVLLLLRGPQVEVPIVM